MISNADIDMKKGELEKVKNLQKTLTELEKNIKAMNGMELPMQLNTDLVNMRSLNLRITAKLNLEQDRRIDEVCDEIAIKREP